MKLWSIALLVPILVAAAPASAADSVQALKEARKLTGEATVEYNVGHFERALDLYAEAYERYPKPALLFDLGQCHRQLGHYERAIFFFQGYLREQPAAANRALVEKFIDTAQQQLDAQRATEAAQAQARAAEAARAQNPPSVSSPVPGTLATATEPSPARPTEASSPVLRTVGFVTAGVGALLVGGGTYAGLRSASLAKEISQVSARQGAWTPQYQSDYQSGKSFATVANVLYVSGAALLATGIAFTVFGWPRTVPAVGLLTPLPGGASVDLVARF